MPRVPACTRIPFQDFSPMTSISLRRLGFTAAVPLFDDLSFTLFAG